MLDYFSLWADIPVAGARGIGKVRQIVLYVGVLAGIGGKLVYDHFASDQFITIPSIILSIIISIVIFPKIYYDAGLNKGDLNFVKWCVAFQNGYFWTAIFDAVSQSFV